MVTRWWPGVYGSGTRGSGYSGVHGGTHTRTVVTVHHHGLHRAPLPYYPGTTPPPTDRLVYSYRLADVLWSVHQASFGYKGVDSKHAHFGTLRNL